MHPLHAIKVNFHITLEMNDLSATQASERSQRDDRVPNASRASATGDLHVAGAFGHVTSDLAAVSELRR